MADPKPIRMKIGFKKPLPAYADKERAAQIVKRNTAITMQGAVNILHGAVVTNTPHGFGTLRWSISGVTLDHGSSIVGKVSTPSPYGLPVETGSRPHWIPIGPLKLWAIRKGYGASFAYYVRWLHAPLSYSVKSRKKTGAGIPMKGYFMFAKGFRTSKDRIRKLFRDAQAKMLGDLKKR
jgi:hypothetical protein